MQNMAIDAFMRDPDPALASVEAGTTIVLTRDGLPVLRLEPIATEVDRECD